MRTLQDCSEFAGIIFESAMPLIAIEAFDASKTCQQSCLHRLLKRQQPLPGKHRRLSQSFICPVNTTSNKCLQQKSLHEQVVMP